MELKWCALSRAQSQCPDTHHTPPDTGAAHLFARDVRSLPPLNERHGHADGKNDCNKLKHGNLWKPRGPAHLRGASAGDREAGYDLRRSSIIGRRAAPRLGGPKDVAVPVV